MRLRGNTNGNSFSAVLTLTNQIVLPEARYYKLSIYSFFHCFEQSCVNANDEIQIKMKEDNAVDYIVEPIFRLGTDSGRKDRTWKLEEACFKTETNRINVYVWKLFAFNYEFYIFIFQDSY